MSQKSKIENKTEIIKIGLKEKYYGNPPTSGYG